MMASVPLVNNVPQLSIVKCSAALNCSYQHVQQFTFIEFSVGITRFIDAGTKFYFKGGFSGLPVGNAYAIHNGVSIWPSSFNIITKYYFDIFSKYFSYLIFYSILINILYLHFYFCIFYKSIINFFKLIMLLLSIKSYHIFLFYYKLFIVIPNYSKYFFKNCPV